MWRNILESNHHLLLNGESCLYSSIPQPTSPRSIWKIFGGCTENVCCYEDWPLKSRAFPAFLEYKPRVWSSNKKFMTSKGKTAFCARPPAAFELFSWPAWNFFGARIRRRDASASLLVRFYAIWIFSIALVTNLVRLFFWVSYIWMFLFSYR